QSFTDQQGVPLVTFTGANGRYTVTQSRYARLGTSAPQTRWGVPLCVRRGTTRNCTLLTEATGTVTLAGSGALMPNAGGTGAYRRFVGTSYQPILRELGFDPRAGVYAGEPSERSQRRQQAVGALAGVAKDPGLRNRLSAAAAAFLGGDERALDAAWYGAALDP